MKALFILSIVVPISLLTTLRLTGILQGPITITETTTLEAVQWELGRPNQTLDILNELGNTFSSDELSVNMYILMVSYHNNSQFGDDNDYLRMEMVINSTATNPNVFMESVNIVFSEDSQPSLVDWLHESFKFENFSLVGISSGWTNGEQHKTAFVKLARINHPERIYFLAVAEWSLLTPHNQTHQIKVVYELTYNNGTAYKKIVQPFQLKITGR